MSTLKPGQNSGKDGGIYREQGPRGGSKDNYAQSLTTIARRQLSRPAVRGLL